MKKYVLLLALIVVSSIWVLICGKTKAADGPMFQTHEYVTIRWGGRENTHLIRANGKVEMLGPILSKVARPERTDDRAFYMNVAMNAVAQEGYEFAGMTSDEIVMKRAISR